jgi:uncharacterized repeat protein (TIGR01451 family)
MAALVCALCLTGCAMQSGIDPSGQGILAPVAPQGNCPQTRFRDYPHAQRSWDDVGVTLNPATVVAPVGSEVILLGGVKGRDNCLRTNRRIDWSITEGSVGHFVDVGENGWCDYLAGDFTHRRKVDNSYAIGSTSYHGLRLHRGTPNTDDDVHVLSGQGWVSLTSPIEGASNVTLYAPDVYAWNARTASAVVHWVDSRWRLPSPASATAGTRHLLSTRVERQSDGSPVVGWRVRYTITSGPDAGFDPHGGATAEAVTDADGMGSVEIFQRQVGPGLNAINVEVVRPGEIAGTGGKQLVMRAGATSVNWVAGGSLPVTPPPTTVTPSGSGIDLQVTGPSEAAVGAEVLFEISITNRGQAPASGLKIWDRYEPGLVHPEIKRNPIAKDIERTLAPGETYLAHVIFRVTQAGRWCHTVEITGPNGMLASRRMCISAGDAAPGTRPSTGATPAPERPSTPNPTIPRPSVSVSKTGPSEGTATVGEEILFNIDVVNNGSQTLTDVTLVDQYDPGLEAVAATDGYTRELRGLVWKIASLPTGDSQTFQVRCRCEMPVNRTCNRASVTTREGAQGSSEACVQIRQAASTFPGGLFPSTTPTTPGADAGTAAPGTPTPGTATPGTAPAERLAISIRSSRPQYQSGTVATYRIDVTNTGDRLDRWMRVEVAVPEGVTIDPLGTTGPGTSRPQIIGRTIRFEQVADIAPNQTLTYDVRLQTRAPGTFVVRASAMSQEQPRPVVVDSPPIEVVTR